MSSQVCGIRDPLEPHLKRWNQNIGVKPGLAGFQSLEFSKKHSNQCLQEMHTHLKPFPKEYNKASDGHYRSLHNIRYIETIVGYRHSSTC